MYKSTYIPEGVCTVHIYQEDMYKSTYVPGRHVQYIPGGHVQYTPGEHVQYIPGIKGTNGSGLFRISTREDMYNTVNWEILAVI